MRLALRRLPGAVATFLLPASARKEMSKMARHASMRLASLVFSSQPLFLFLQDLRVRDKEDLKANTFSRRLPALASLILSVPSPAPLFPQDLCLELWCQGTQLYFRQSSVWSCCADFLERLGTIASVNMRPARAQQNIAKHSRAR